jgi:ABC-type Zn uptake system ZnuABC Zn-binding protein ZnuA
MRKQLLIIILLMSTLVAACRPAESEPGSTESEGEALKVLAVESTLADIAQNIGGERVQIEVLIPPPVDLHTFQPTPQDVAKIADSQMLIANGAGLEEWLQEVLDNAGKEQVVEAAEGLVEKSDRPGDPHFWLDPNYVIHYATQIRDGLVKLDPGGEALYIQNAEGYLNQLAELDAWITGQVAQIPPEQRRLVTNHESLGYYAERYGFEIIGTIIPSVSTGSSPSAQQMVSLIESMKNTNTPAIFLESGSNPELAEQLAREAGIQVIVDLRTQPLYPQEGYIEMMQYNTQAIVEALR